MPIDETDSGEQQTNTLAQVPPPTHTHASVKHSTAPALLARWNLHFLDDIRPGVGRMSYVSMGSATAIMQLRSRSSLSICIGTAIHGSG